MKYTIDGNQVCCTRHNFRNLAVGPAGFGDSLEASFLDLIRQSPLKEGDLLQDWEAAWLVLEQKPLEQKT